MKNNLLIYLFIAVTIALSSCKGKDGEVGPAGPAGASYDPTKDYVYKEGNIKGTATGTLVDGTTPYSYNYDFQGVYGPTNNAYTVNSESETEIQISKSYSGEGDAFVYGYMYMRFTVTSLTDLSSPILNSMSIDWTKDLGSNKFHRTYYSWYTGNPSASGTVSNLSYNSTTGVLTGNYTFTMAASSDKGSLSITNGSFSTKLSHIVARMSAQ